jgi:stage III sporulation protein AE
MKRILLTLCLIPLFFSLFAFGAEAADSGSIVRQQMQQSGAAGLYQKAPDSAKQSLGNLELTEPDTGGLSKFTPAGVFHILQQAAVSAAKRPIKSVVSVFGILLVCALLGTLKNSFSEKSLQPVFDIVCALCIAAAVLVPVTQCIADCASTMKQSSEFMTAFLPVFAALVTASGHPASAAVFQGMLLAASQLIAQIAATTFVPMVSIYLAFCVIGSVSPGIQISGIAGFFKTALNWALGACLTVFVGILTVQSMISQAADTVTIKAAKFVVGSAVPVIGSTISDAINTVVSCANLLKTATGAYGIIVFAFAYLPVLLECLLWILAADVMLAITEVLGVSNMAGLLRSIKYALQVLTALVFSAALAMIISLSVMLMVGMGN